VNQRLLTPERMDDPAIDPADHAHALRGLARLNTLSGIRRTVARELRAISKGDPLTVLDIAAGSGDLVLALAARPGSPHTYTASDLSPFACETMRRAAEARSIPLDVRTLDALRDDLPPHDVVMCHLFLHHLERDDIARLLARMHAAARRAVLVTDLARTRLGCALARLASRVATRSPVVHHDALASVRAALTPAELAEIADEAGLAGRRIRTAWPERMILTCPAR